MRPASWQLEANGVQFAYLVKTSPLQPFRNAAVIGRCLCCGSICPSCRSREQAFLQASSKCEDVVRAAMAFD